ncbi:hypothetical protein T440DRAFT_271480 [Plenodomus tracheiphilus IPT5]|uniref:TM7S3/TM198-like domain-containing protein n=1 Tax=Plenodomus tracheiphilus IPT5 TaxID=1408161 RepID=A0A6A7BFH4_9PLEO|nr:hypothetical protein T440DRAFT_271480 [Plenodomus tracheiphilus IPT5]
MRPTLRFLVAFVALILCIHSVIAAPRAAVRRQDDNQIETQSGSEVSSARPSATPSPSVSGSESARASSIISVSTKSLDAPSSSTSHVPATSTSDQSTPTNTANAATQNQLPIQPKLTPAMGLSGVILLLSGLVYAVIGIKNKWVYVFGSAAYLTALAVSVLIVYLMSPPVSNAVQGAFFVAAFVTGVIFGALSLVFSDITEGFGCLLGGFCLSMWFLSLKDGGLISSTTGRAIFIGCMSVGGYSLSFSHYTRNHGLIASIAFSGATAALLGIDCLASSGWKEFWLYLWNLNDDVFPLNTNTYPVTKNIKAELAGVVIIAVFGVISQLRVWKMVQEHRANSAAQQLEKQQDQEREEEALGRKIEDDFHKERAQWEAAYGDGGKSVQDSSIRSSTIGPKRSTSIRETELSGNDSVEMVNLTKSGVTQASNGDTPAGTTVTINVLQDDDIRQIDSLGNPVDHHLTHAAPAETKSSKRSSAPPPPPTVIPLPFTVPLEEDATSVDDNISVSAIPDSDQISTHHPRPMSKRISDMSAMRLRVSRDATYSQEALISHADANSDRASSVAATLDDDNDVNSLRQISPPHSPLDAQHATPLENLKVSIQEEEEEDRSSTGLVASSLPSSGEADGADKAAFETVTEVAALQKGARKSFTPSTDPKVDEVPNEPSNRRESRVRADTLVPGADEDNEQSNSDPKQAQVATVPQAGRAESHVGSLRDGVLPAKLSKVAQSYRTNEWAKHLEVAEKPSLDDLEVPDSPGVALAEGFPKEVPAPVSDELTSSLMGSKRTSRRASREGTIQGTSSHDLIRSASTFSQNSLAGQQTWTQSPPVAPLGNLSRSSSSTQIDVLAPLPSHTLMGQRESLIRNRASSQSLTPKSSAANLLVEAKDLENMTLAQRRQILQSQQTGISMLQHQSSVTTQRRAPPSASQKWQNKGWSAKGAPPGFDSHQPKRNSSSQSNQKREQLYAGWRDTMRDVTPPQTAVFTAEQQRQALLNDRRQKELERQQRELHQQQRASQMDSMMRSSQMLEAHREAMRKMQADANKRS